MPIAPCAHVTDLSVNAVRPITRSLHAVLRFACILVCVHASPSQPHAAEQFIAGDAAGEVDSQLFERLAEHDVRRKKRIKRAA